VDQIVTRRTDLIRERLYAGHVETSQKNSPEEIDRDVWPDEKVPEKRETGSSDPYLAELAQQCRATTTESPCPTPFESRGWMGDDRRGHAVDSFDPYVVELTRASRSDI